MVVDAQPAAKIDMGQRDAGRLNRGDQVKHPVHRVQIRRHLGDLRADMAIDADHLQPRKRSRMLVDAQRVFMRDAKLVALQAG